MASIAIAVAIMVVVRAVGAAVAVVDVADLLGGTHTVAAAVASTTTSSSTTTAAKTIKLYIPPDTAVGVDTLIHRVDKSLPKIEIKCDLRDYATTASTTAATKQPQS